MLKRLAPILVVLMAASVAHAQIGGGGGGGGGAGGGGHRGGGGNKGGGAGAPKTAAAPAAPKSPETPVNQLQFVGVVKSIDAGAERLTIAYEPVEVLNWQAGTMPFPVAKSALMKGVTVGQKVRFNIDSGHISAIAPFDPPAAP